MAQVTRTSEEILPEDIVTNALIENKFQGFDCSVEERYEYYGERGYVDLVVKDRNYLAAIEIKSNPQKANDIIRQVNKMRENFIPGTDYSEKKSTYFYLYFTTSQRTYQHLKNNEKMYRSLSCKKDVSIWMADEKGNQLQVFSPSQDFNTEEWKKTANKHLEGVQLQDDNLSCPYCGKEYKMESYFKSHVKTCQGNGAVTKVKA